MHKIGIFYGSSTGTCEGLAAQLAGELGVADNDVHSANKLTEELVNTYDVLVLGTSTWGSGDVQDDWYDAMDVLKGMDFTRQMRGPVWLRRLRVVLRNLLRRNRFSL